MSFVRVIGSLVQDFRDLSCCFVLVHVESKEPMRRPHIPSPLKRDRGRKGATATEELKARGLYERKDLPKC